jgi:hypothetical protein
MNIRSLEQSVSVENRRRGHTLMHWLSNEGTFSLTLKFMKPIAIL